jgi:hypothetical protein
MYEPRNVAAIKAEGDRRDRKIRENQVSIGAKQRIIGQLEGSPSLSLAASGGSGRWV